MHEAYLVRPAEDEIYGRSLSTIFKMGSFMVQNSLRDSLSSPEADQARVEFYTSVEEGFGTDLELGGGLEVRDFDERQIVNGRVMSKDLKTAITDMTEAGVTCAIKEASKDKRFTPQLTRSDWDHKNALIVDQMARGETDYNTRIVISPFPEEAARASGDEYWRHIGYVPHLRRGFVQLYYVSDGKVTSGSLSFDGSNKERLIGIFAKHGVTIPDGEITDNWLKYAITGNLTEEMAKELATEIADQADGIDRKNTTNTVDVTDRYRHLIDQVFDESYIHIGESLYRGKQTDEVNQLVHRLANKAHYFNDRYSSALYRMRANSNQFTDDDSIVLHELLVYSTIEMMRAFHLKDTNSFLDSGLVSLDLVYDFNSAHFQDTLFSFGAEGAISGRAYSACGISISAGKDGSDGPQGSYGGVDGKGSKERYSDDKLGSRYFICPKLSCREENVRPKNWKIDRCKRCGTDVSCSEKKAWDYFWEKMFEGVGVAEGSSEPVQAEPSHIEENEEELEPVNA